MITWRLDRLRTAGAACGLASLAVLLGAALVMSTVSDVNRLFGGFAVGLIFIAVANATGSPIPMVFGVLVYGLVAGASQLGVWWMALAGCSIYVAAVLWELSVSLRREASTDRAFWASTVASTAIVIVVATALAALAWLVATRATWQAIVVPLAIVALGLAVRLAVDVHARRVGDRGGAL